MTTPNQPNHPGEHIQGLREHMNQFQKTRKHSRAMDLIAELEHLLNEMVSRGEPADTDQDSEELPQPVSDQPTSPPVDTSQPTQTLPAPPAPEGAVPVADENPPAEGTTPDDSAVPVTEAPVMVEAPSTEPDPATQQPPGSEPA
jgi:hypothetical protein